ncbi:MAG: hypothetical protein IJR45_01805 [Firmicutes bacterium]|nr:hypothetical protein [Bacillota bacterium]MBQ9604129.1 hypothetical protein [Bacillota bacterium]
MEYEHMTLKDWMITMLIMLIPCVNIVMMFVWAFGSNVNPSKKTYFQAVLIWAAIGIVLEILWIVLLGGAAAMSSMGSNYNMIGLF